MDEQRMPFPDPGAPEIGAPEVTSPSGTEVRLATDWQQIGTTLRPIGRSPARFPARLMQHAPFWEQGQNPTRSSFPKKRQLPNRSPLSVAAREDIILS